MPNHEGVRHFVCRSTEVCAGDFFFSPHTALEKILILTIPIREYIMSIEHMFYTVRGWGFGARNLAY